MSSHYYTNRPTVESNKKSWTYTLKNNLLKFISDNGVFSKNSVDFGSRLLIESFDIPAELQGTSLLDVGCGYGTFGIAYGKAYPELSMEMVDVNERAIELAKLNANLNGVSNVNIHPSYIYEDVEGRDFGVVISNPPIRAGKKVVHQIISEAHQYLREGGYLVIVIQKKQGAPSAEKLMEEVYGNCEKIAKDKGYWILVSQK